MEENLSDKKISEDGTLDVQVSVVGDIVGSDHEGNPIQQHIDAESLQKIADDLNESGKPCLCDVDHQSSKQGLDRNTRAAGWLKTWWTNVKGLFAKLHLTPYGRQLVEGKEYTQLSPVFVLDESGRPTSLVAASLTNTAAMQDIDTLLNQKPNEALKMEITKEELIELIKETVGAMMEPKAEETQEEQPVADEKPEEQQDTLEEKEEEKEEAVCEEPEEEKPEEKEEEKKPEEEKKEEKKEEKEEVIKEAALNSMPTKATVGEKPWGSLKGEELLAWAYRNHI